MLPGNGDDRATPAFNQVGPAAIAFELGGASAKPFGGLSPGFIIKPIAQTAAARWLRASECQQQVDQIGREGPLGLAPQGVGAKGGSSDGQAMFHGVRCP